MRSISHLKIHEVHFAPKKDKQGHILRGPDGKPLLNPTYQFDGIHDYEHDLPKEERINVDACLKIANSDGNPYQEIMEKHVRSAIDIAGAPASASGARPIFAWRTQGYGPPGPNFEVVDTVLGNTFFTIKPEVLKHCIVAGAPVKPHR